MTSFMSNLCPLGARKSGVQCVCNAEENESRFVVSHKNVLTLCSVSLPHYQVPKVKVIIDCK